jgi:hypothetical protein
MTRVVLLTFKDNAAAEALVKRLDQLQNEAWDLADNETEFTSLGLVLASTSKVEAVLARPLASCNCSPRPKFSAWKRTEVFGWHVCPKCNRPAPLVVRNWLANLVRQGGNNLLPALLDKLHKENLVGTNKGQK